MNARKMAEEIAKEIYEYMRGQGVLMPEMNYPSIPTIVKRHILAAQSEPNASLRKTMEDLYKSKTMKRLLETVEYGKSNRDQVIIDKRRKQQFIKAVLAAIRPVMQKYREMIQKLIDVVGLLDDTICDEGIILGNEEKEEFNTCWDNAQTLIGRKND